MATRYMLQIVRNDGKGFYGSGGSTVTGPYITFPLSGLPQTVTDATRAPNSDVPPFPMTTFPTQTVNGKTSKFVQTASGGMHFWEIEKWYVARDFMQAGDRTAAFVSNEAPLDLAIAYTGLIDYLIFRAKAGGDFSLAGASTQRNDIVGVPFVYAESGNPAGGNETTPCIVVATTDDTDPGFATFYHGTTPYPGPRIVCGTATVIYAAQITGANGADGPNGWVNAAWQADRDSLKTWLLANLP